MNKLVVLDIDGVVADFEGKLVKTLISEGFLDGADNRGLFRLEDRYSPETLKRAQELTADQNFYYDLRRVPGAFSFVSDLMDSGFSVMFVSSRPEYMARVTRRWLRKELGWYFRNSFGLFCGVSDKADFLSELDGSTIDFVVEDNPEQIGKLKKTGFITIAWEQPWNEGVYPRFYLRNDGELMLRPADYLEAEPFWSIETGETI